MRWLCLGLVLCALPASASGPTRLLEDINVTVEAHDSGPSKFTLLGSQILFTSSYAGSNGYVGGVGAELYALNPVTHAASLVRDIRPGYGGATPGPLAVFGGKIYFCADDGTHGNELWSSDGTPSGTTLVGDLNPGYADGCDVNSSAYVFAGQLWFRGKNATSGEELFVTDGSSEVLLKDINAGAGSSFPYGFSTLGSKLYFAASPTGAVSSLYSTDGTIGSAVAASGFAGVSSLFTFASTLVFFADAGDGNGNELQVYDGASTYTEYDLNPGAGASTPSTAAYAVMGGDLFFQATDASHGQELWKFDGVTAPTRLSDINPGSGNSSPSTLTPIGSTLYFAAFDGASIGMYSTDGTTVTPVDPSVVPQTAYASSVATLGTSIFFGGVLAPSGNELYTQAGLFADITAGSSISTSLVTVGSTLYFAGTDAIHGNEPWSTDGVDGSSGHTALEANVAPDAGDSSPQPFCTVGDNLFFTTKPAPLSNTAVLRITDGTTTQLLHTFNAGIDTDGNSHGAAVINGSLILLGDNGDGNGDQLWASDGTASGTTRVQAAVSSTYSPDEVTAVGNVVYFSATSPSGDRELYSSDGTDTGTALAFNISPSGSSSPNTLIAFGTTLLFSADDGVHGQKLWALDTTGNSVAMVGSGVSFTNPAAGNDGHVYFAGDDGVNGTELWRTDGQTVERLTDLNPGSASSFPGQIVMAGSAVLFSANDGSHYQLWSYDPASTNVTALLDLAARSPAGTIWVLVGQGHHAFFTLGTSTSNDPGTLWQSDGTALGTTPVTDAGGVLRACDPEILVAALDGQHVLFAGFDDAHGLEPWLSDGTTQGTLRIDDIAPGNLPSNPKGFSFTANQLFIAADDYSHGFEPWLLDLPSLQVSATPPGMASDSGTFSIVFTVTNSGAAAASGVVLTTTLPAGVTATSITASQGSCANVAGVVTCNLGVIAAQAQPTVTFVESATAGSLSQVANATTSSMQNGKATGQATASFTVVASLSAASGATGTSGSGAPSGSAGSSGSSGATGPVATATTKTGCTCHGSEPPYVWFALVAAVLWRRRRKA